MEIPLAIVSAFAALVQAETMKQIPLQSALALSAIGAISATLVDNCRSETFTNLEVFGAEVLGVSASAVQNFSTTTEEGQSYSGLNFCNVTVTYTHPGRGDTVNVFAALPLNGWNGRFQGRGGAGFVTGFDAAAIAPETAKGFAVASTDGGHTIYDMSAQSWALNSPGNIDWNLLEDYAHKALSDLTLFGKQVTAKFFDEPPKYSYWTGCSTGGRQGLQLAQKYPDLYDGILAMAPAIQLNGFVVAEYYVEQLMNRMVYYPFPCELEAFTKEAIVECDEMDGVKDGIISLPSLCKFDPETVVGKEFDCGGEKMTLTKGGALLAKAFWTGPVNPSDPEKWYWYGLNHDVPFNGLAGTKCTNSSISSCSGDPFIVAEEFIRLFLQKDPNYAITNMTDDEYFEMFHKSAQEYNSMLATSDPDLSAFKAHGGKMITWHGLADQLIPVNGSSRYYEQVKELDADVTDYYRYFEVPGVYHCLGGKGPIPNNDETLATLMEWVENGTAPETLTAKSQADDGAVRELCLWPKTLVYAGGKLEKADSWRCE